MTVPGTVGNPLYVKDDTTSGPLLVDSESPLMTAATYSGGLMATYTEQRISDSKTRTVTITRNGDGTIASQSASAWA